MFLVVAVQLLRLFIHFSEMNAKIKDTNQYKVLAVIVTGFIVVFVISSWKWALWIALLAGITGLISTKILALIILFWDKISQILSKIIPNILLATVFYFFLTPVAILAKLFTRADHLKLKNNSSSLFNDYNKEIKASDFEKPW